MKAINKIWVFALGTAVMVSCSAVSYTHLAIDDVIVVAYGTAKKEAFTGSASVMKAEDIGKRQVSNISNALAGLAGVVVNIRGRIIAVVGVYVPERLTGVGTVSYTHLRPRPRDPRRRHRA